MSKHFVFFKYVVIVGFYGRRVSWQMFKQFGNGVTQPRGTDADFDTEIVKILDKKNCL